jgi:hypothetical protein
MIISFEDAQKRYGEIINLHWANEAKWMVIAQVPDVLSNLWINSATGQPTRHVYINKDAKDPLLAALQNIINAQLEHELKTFDGCFNIRDVRGVPGKPSWHSYGLAIDVNAKDNVLGQTPKLSPEFIKCWTDAGWTWGGNFGRKDGMHFQVVLE